MTTFLFVLLSCGSAAGQIPDKGNTAVGVPTFSVSPEQERNFNAFMSWLDTQESFKLKEGLKGAYRGLFVAMKRNDYAEYASWWKKFQDELSKLSDEQKSAMYKFFLTLSVENVQCPSPGDNGCVVNCLFGCCTINCPTGTKPKCFCQWGMPQCGCEPYQ